MKTFFLSALATFALVGCVTKREFVDPNAYAEGKTMRHGFWFGAESPKAEAPKFQPDAKAAERGAKLYASHCLKCHGPQGRGDGAEATKLKHTPANLKAFAGMFPHASFFMQIAPGKDEMPAWKDTLSQNEINDLSQYLHTLVPKK